MQRSGQRQWVEFLGVQLSGSVKWLTVHKGVWTSSNDVVPWSSQSTVLFIWRTLDFSCGDSSCRAMLVFPGSSIWQRSELGGLGFQCEVGDSWLGVAVVIVIRRLAS